MTRRLLILICTLTIASALGCACRSKDRAEPFLQDVVPTSWISYNGQHVCSTEESNGAYVFPSTGELESPAVSYDAPRFLRRGDELPDAAVDSYTLQYPIHSAIQCDKSADSCIRLVHAKGSRDLTFKVSPAGIDIIRNWNWNEFQHQQACFDEWMREQTAPIFWPCLQFDSKELRQFWLNCLEQATLDEQMPPVTRWSPDPGRKRDPKNANDLGPQMGAIPLQPGMRLVIHWGGTALYEYGSTPQQYVRQTVTGSSSIDVTYRGGGLILAIPRFLTPSLPPSAASRKGPWTINSVSPQSGEPGSQSYLPFGSGTHALGRHLVPVFNELDLWDPDALRRFDPKSNEVGDVDDICPFLTLLIPAEYVKADLARSERSAANDPVPGTHDAFDSKQAQNELLRTFGRRFILWGSSDGFAGPLRAPDKGGPPVLDSSNDPVAAVQAWKFAPLIFANQSTISVEVPIAVNAKSVMYVPLGFTIGDVLDTQARWLLTEHPNMEISAVIRRTTINVDGKGPNGTATFHARILRFHGLSAQALHKIEVAPGDSIAWNEVTP